MGIILEFACSTVHGTAALFVPREDADHPVGDFARHFGQAAGAVGIARRGNREITTTLSFFPKSFPPGIKCGVNSIGNPGTDQFYWLDTRMKTIPLRRRGFSREPPRPAALAFIVIPAKAGIQARPTRLSQQDDGNFLALPLIHPPADGSPLAPRQRGEGGSAWARRVRGLWTKIGPAVNRYTAGIFARVTHQICLLDNKPLAG
jgi:hypothetical protein